MTKVAGGAEASGASGATEPARFDVIQTHLDFAEFPAGVSAEWYAPATPHAVVTLAHGAGAGMQHDTMTAIAAGLAGHGIATLRFNFPFKELGKPRVDSVAVATATVDAALSSAQAKYPDLVIYGAGHSFGGRMTSHLAATDGAESPFAGLVFFAFPLHPAGKPATKRADHLDQIARPMLFLSGTRDALAEAPLLENVVARLTSAQARLYRMHDADHSYKARKRERGDQGPVIPEMVAVAAEFVAD